MNHEDLEDFFRTYGPLLTQKGYRLTSVQPEYHASDKKTPQRTELNGTYPDKKAFLTEGKLHLFLQPQELPDFLPDTFGGLEIALAPKKTGPEHYIALCRLNPELEKEHTGETILIDTVTGWYAIGENPEPSRTLERKASSDKTGTFYSRKIGSSQ